MVDLLKQVTTPLSVDFFQTSSYGATKVPGEIRIRKDVDMSVRTRDDLKRGRLQLLGIDADGTLKAVGRGLRALATRQQTDGSFAAGGGRSDVGQTALALLPFLGEGHGSRTTGSEGRDVVAPGIAWIRRQLFPGGEPRAIEAADLGIALKALSEDYMLS